LANINFKVKNNLDILGTSLTVAGSVSGTTTISAPSTGGNTLTLPSASGTIATNEYVVGLVGTNVQTKEAVKAATTANIDLAVGGLLVIDGYQTIASDRILVKNQTALKENGIYVAGAGAWTRSTDTDSTTEIKSAVTFVENGNTYSGWTFLSFNSDWNTFTLNAVGSTGELTWRLFSKQSTNIPVTDNSPSAFKVFEGTNNYIVVDTSNGAEKLKLGNDDLVLYRGLNYGIMAKLQGSGGALTLAGGTGTSGTVAIPGVTDAGAVGAFTGALTVAGGAAIAAGLNVGTFAYVSGNLTVKGNTQLGDATGDTLTIFPGAVTWSGTSPITHSNNHTFSGNIIISGSATINGNIQLGDNTSDTLTIFPGAVTWSGASPITHSNNHTFSSNVVVAGSTTLNGNVQLGDNSTDTLTVYPSAVTWAAGGTTHANAHTFSGDVTFSAGVRATAGSTTFFSEPTGSVSLFAGSGATDTITIGGSSSKVIVQDLEVQGTTTTINATTLTVDDKNIELGSVGAPTDTTADGGGITLKGATDKTIIWDNANDNWSSNQSWNLLTGLAYKINNATVLDSTTLYVNKLKSTSTAGPIYYSDTAGTYTSEAQLAVTRGGTGASSVNQYGVVFGSSTSAYGSTAAGTTGQVLVATTGGNPSWSAAPVFSTSITTPIIQGTAGAAGTVTIRGGTDTTGTIALNAATIDSSSLSSLFATPTLVTAFAAATTLTIGGVATAQTITIGGGSTAASTYNFGTGAVASATKTINIGTTVGAGGTSNVNIGASSGITTINGTAQLTSGSTKVGTTVLTQGAATAISFPAVNGTLVGSGDVNTVANTMIRQSAGLSVVGRAANSLGNVADITGTDGQVLRVSGLTLGFGTITNAGLANSTISGVALGNNLFGLTAGTGLSWTVGTTYNGSAASTLTVSGITNAHLSGTAGITNANLANSTISGVALGGTLFGLTAGTGLSWTVGTTYTGTAASTLTVSGITNAHLSGTAGITNANLANSTISGVALGGTLNGLSAGTGLSWSIGTTYTGTAVSTLAVSGITNAHLSGTAGITNANLANSAVTIGSTSVSLGATVTTFAGLVSVTSTTFVGALTGNASTATTAGTVTTAAQPAITSVGTLTGLTVTNPISGSVTGTAGSISGYNNPTTAASANTIVYRDASAYIWAAYFNGTGTFPLTGSAAASGMGTFTGTNGIDNYGRGYTAAAAATLLSGQTMNISGSSTSCSGNSATASVSTHLAGGNNTTLLGAVHYQADSNVTSQVTPNTTTTKKFLRQTGTGTNGAHPAWDTIAAADVPVATATTPGAVPTPPNNTTTYLRGDATWQTLPDAAALSLMYSIALG
jgi:hypothetical protein